MYSLASSAPFSSQVGGDHPKLSKLQARELLVPPLLSSSLKGVFVDPVVFETGSHITQAGFMTVDPSVSTCVSRLLVYLP